MHGRNQDFKGKAGVYSVTFAYKESDLASGFEGGVDKLVVQANK